MENVFLYFLNHFEFLGHGNSRADFRRVTFVPHTEGKRSEQ